MIQIDIPMPKSCGECPICNEYLMCGVPCNGRGWGENDVSDYYSNGRPEWCPLKEQKEMPKLVKIDGQFVTVKYGHCPTCGEGLNQEVYPHWCGFCGQELRWE